jgi:type IV pilus assembly protein PilM
VAVKARSGRILSIDWDVRSVRVVHASVSKRGVSIDRLLSAEIPPDVHPSDPAQMGAHIRRVLEQERIKTRVAVVDIPRDQAILKALALPTAKVEDLPGMVGIQIARELPFPALEAVIDFVSTGPSADDAAGVLVAATRREVLAQYEAIFEQAGLKLERVGLRPYANQVAVAELLKHAVPEHVLFIDVGPALTEIDVLRQGVLAFSRAASVVIPKAPPAEKQTGGLRLSLPAENTLDLGDTGVPRPGTSSDSVIQSLVVEVMRSIEAYRSSDVGAGIDHVVIGGDMGVEEALADALQKKLSVTTQLYNPATSFGWEPDEGTAAAAFASALGLVLSHASGSSLHFDFLHPKRTESQTRRRLRMAPAAAAIAILFVSAAGIVIARTSKPDRDELARIEQTIQELEENKDEHKKFQDVMQQIRQFDGKQLVWVDVLFDVMQPMPSNEEWLITNLDMNQQERRIVLKTKSKSRDTPLNVVKALEAFRRDGKEKPCFKAHAGQQSEKRGEKYPFQQDVRITVLEDESPAKKNGKGTEER